MVFNLGRLIVVQELQLVVVLVDLEPVLVELQFVQNLAVALEPDFEQVLFGELHVFEVDGGEAHGLDVRGDVEVGLHHFDGVFGVAFYKNCTFEDDHVEQAFFLGLGDVLVEKVL